MLKVQPKIKSLHRLLLDVKKFAIGFSRSRGDGKKLIVMNDHKSCTLLLICGCKCICAVRFSNCYACTIFLFEKASGNWLFSTVSELLGLTSREWYGEENFLFQKLVFMDVDQTRCVKLFWNSNNANPFQQV